MKKVNLFLYIPAEQAAHVVGRLWANGTITRAQYEQKMKQVDANKLAIESERNKKLRNLYAGIREFYTKSD